MLSPHMLKSTGLQRRPTLSPERRKKCDREKYRQNRSGSMMVYVGEEDDYDAFPISGGRNSLTDELLTEDSNAGRYIPIPSNRGRRTPSPSAAMLGGSSPARYSISGGSFKESDHFADKESKEDAKLQRRKTSTAASLMRKLKIQSGKSSQPAEKEACKIEVHHYSNDPTIAWEMLKVKQPVKTVKPMPLGTPMRDECVRFVCLADTHGAQLDNIFIPDGDVLLVAGNFTQSGHPSEVKAFNKFLGTLPHKYKIVVAGNHELTFDGTWQPTNSVFGGLEKLFKAPAGDRASFIRGVLQTALAQENVAHPRQLLTNCVYLEDQCVNVCGLKIYGAPWVPIHDHLAFNLPRGQKLLDKWNLIPAGIDVLITQTPPLGHGDLCHDGHRAGCVELLSSIRRRIHPKYHVFGHIRESYGCTTDGYTKFINACILDSKKRPANPPVIFDIALPSGAHKD